MGNGLTMQVNERPGQPAWENKGMFQKLLIKVNEVTRNTDTQIAFSKNAINNASKKAGAKTKIDERNKLFDSFDTDKDGFLNRREVLKYAKSKFDFTIPESMYSEMAKYLVADGQKGVPKA